MVAFCAVRRHRDAGGLMGLPVMHEEITGIIDIVRHQVSGVRLKDDKAPVS